MAEAEIQAVRRPRVIWLVPAVAVVLGIWLVVDSYLGQGPNVTVKFQNAEGVEPGRTKVRALSVEIGLVSAVALADDLSGVNVTLDLDPTARRLLREDSRFWVVRPRIGATGITGLGTIISGSYIELDPGAGKAAGRRRFAGLNEVPLTDALTPGIRLRLISDTAGSIGIGNPVLYRGYRVGRVETAALDVQTEQVRYSIFIDAPYDKLVTQSSRFWDVSGVTAKLSADGLEIGIDSLQSLITGGVAFDVHRGATATGPAEPMTEFRLHPSRQAANDDPYRYYVDYTVDFGQSLRGLRPGAPVEYRGIRIGSVREILVQDGFQSAAQDGSGAPLPVLIRLEPGRLEIGDDEDAIQRMKDAIEREVGNGLRARLATGNLLTGAAFVTFDYYPNEAPAEIGEFAGRPALPTVKSGFNRIENQVTALLAKLNALPVDQTIAGTNAALTELETTLRTATGTLDDLRAVFGTDAARNVPSALAQTLTELDTTIGTVSPDLQRTITELHRTLEDLRILTRTLNEDPNAIIFPRSFPADPQPRAADE